MATALACVAGAGCSLSWQIGSLAPEQDVTGSTTRHPSPLSPALDAEDWRRARAALSVALDLQGNGKPVSWDNPESGLKGSFEPIGSAFVAKDEICRNFMAELKGAEPQTFLRALACRQGQDTWAIRDVKQGKR